MFGFLKNRRQVRDREEAREIHQQALKAAALHSERLDRVDSELVGAKRDIQAHVKAGDRLLARRVAGRIAHHEALRHTILTERDLVLKIADFARSKASPSLDWERVRGFMSRRGNPALEVDRDLVREDLREQVEAEMVSAAQGDVVSGTIADRADQIVRDAFCDRTRRLEMGLADEPSKAREDGQDRVAEEA